MKNRLSILLVIVGLFISSCSKPSDSDAKQPKIQAQFPKSNQVSAAPKAQVYRVNWSYCAAPGKIRSAESDGCFRSNQPLYYWLDSGIEPKGILIRRSLPLTSDYAHYEASILARGCYPKHLSPVPLDFYSTHTRMSIHKDVTGLSDVVEDLKLEVEPLSPEEQEQFAKNYNSGSYFVPSGCRNDPREKEKLAPYIPS